MKLDLGNQSISDKKFNSVNNSIFHSYPKKAIFYDESGDEEKFNDYYNLFSLSEGALYSYILVRLQQSNTSQQNIEVTESCERDGDMDNNNRENLVENVFNKKSPNMLIFGADGHYGLKLFNFNNERINVLDFDLDNFIEKNQSRDINKDIIPKSEIFGKYTSKVSFLNKDSLQSDRCGCCGLIAAIAYIKILEGYIDNNLQNSIQKINFDKLEKDCNTGLFQLKVMSDIEQIIDKRLKLKQIIKFSIDENEKKYYHKIQGKKENFFVYICTNSNALNMYL